MNNKKYYYSMEEAINNISTRLCLGFKDANDMDEMELESATKEILKYVEFVEHPEYIQFVPRIIATNELVLPTN